MSNVIDISSRYNAKALEGIAQRDNPVEDNSGAFFFDIHSRSLLALPFVTLPLQKCDDWEDFWKRTSMWNDDPTKEGCVDHRRGRDYARQAIAALIKDGARSRGLEMVLDHMIDRAFKRRGPGGRLCRQLSSAETGFLHELCEIAVEASRGRPLKQP
jgi:hypothetical protein